MAPRLQNNPVQFRESIQPAEQIINTEYYSPAQKPPSRLNELAGALKNFSNDIGGYMDRHKKENDDAAFIRGQAAALKANGADMATVEAEGVRTGLFATFQSDEFVNGYKLTQGQIVGKQLSSKFFTEYQQWEGRNSQDPAAFDQFLGDFIGRNLQTDDPGILKGALPFLTETSTAGYRVNQQERSTALYDSSIDAHVASTALDIDNFVDQGIASGAGVDYEKLWGIVLGERSNALAKGVLAADYDKKMMDLISAKALETGDPALLSLLQNNVPGENYTYANSPDGIALMDTTLKTMATTKDARDRQTKIEQDAADKKLLGEAQVTAINAIIEDPNHVFDEEFLTKAEALDPKFRLDLKQWQENLAKPSPEDSGMILALQSGIITGEFGLEDIVNEMGNDGAIKSQATATQMINLLNSSKDNANQPLFTNQTYKDSMMLLQRELAVKDPLFADPEGLSVAANAARLDYQRSMVTWFQQNPDADYNAIATQSGVVLKRVLEGVTPGGPGQEPAYVTPDEVAQEFADSPNPMSQTEEQVTTEAQAAEAEATQAADPLSVWQTDTPPAFDTLNEDQRSEIEKRARALGETPENYITQLWGNLRDNAASDAPEAPPAEGTPTGGELLNMNYSSTRNNNPGNLRASEFSSAQGATGTDARGFAIFPTLEAGLMAQRALLFSDQRYAPLTMEAAITKYAPPTENDTANYIKVVEQISGVPRSMVMGQMSDMQKQAVQNAFNRMEGSAKPTEGGANFQNVSYQPGGQVSAKPGAGGRLLVVDPTLQDPGFQSHYAQVRGKANFFSSGRNRPPEGNPSTAKWQSTNLTPFSIQGADGKKLNLRVYKPAAAAFQGFLADLQATGYPIHNVGSANYRLKRGGTSLSEHSYGTAIDINGETIPGETSSRNPMSSTFKTDLPENISQLAAKWGLAWGGDWNGTKDTMHFEYTGIQPYAPRVAQQTSARKA